MTDNPKAIRRPRRRRTAEGKLPRRTKKTPSIPIDVTTLSPVITPIGERQVRVLTIEDIPSTDVLLDLGVDPLSTHDFMRALQFVVAQSSGQNVKLACATSGLAPQSVYEPKWQGLISQARRLVLGPALMDLQAPRITVFERWPEIIDKLIHTALHAEKSSDSNEAIELLHLFYVKDAGEAPDASSAQKYLRQSPNFAPMAPLQMIVENGANITINAPGSDPSARSNDDIVVDAEVVESTPPADPLSPLRLEA